jgi:hypothetical protein
MVKVNSCPIGENRQIWSRLKKWVFRHLDAARDDMHHQGKLTGAAVCSWCEM